MEKEYLSNKFKHILHGGDYNPDQWLDVPGIMDKDFALFDLAGINSMSIGIFSWATLEPREGEFDFSMLDELFERAEKTGRYVILATPSGGKPAWMANKYPEINRMCIPGFTIAPGWMVKRSLVPPVRVEHGGRHNHCPTSPIYREKCRIINTKLAERYGNHPMLAFWHVSNEYNTGCECDLCRAAFRDWLKKKYKTLENLNHSWWTPFWSHTYSDWEEIKAVDVSVSSMRVDFQRFCSEQALDFYKAECAPLREISPNIPVTTNFMSGPFHDLDFWKWADEMDVASWDAYPQYHEPATNNRDTAIYFSLHHDLFRSLKGGKPFILMESCPGPTNRGVFNRQLRPGVHRMKSLQAVAHGSDTVCYFQLRKGRGASEKFHGAVIDHAENPNGRMFREIADLSKDLKKIEGVVGCHTPARVALMYDWNARWALEASAGPTDHCKEYFATVLKHYDYFWSNGIPVDMVGPDSNLDKYSLVITPSLYMVSEELSKRFKDYVANGGTLVATYLTGVVNDTDLVHMGGLPGNMRDLFGIWAEEIDYLYPQEVSKLTAAGANKFKGDFELANVCEVIHAEGASVHATFANGDYYDGMPAVTCNRYGKGKAWYIGAEGKSSDMLISFYEDLTAELGVESCLPNVKLPYGVAAQVREGDGERYVFVINYKSTPAEITLPTEQYDILAEETCFGTVTLPPYCVKCFFTSKK
ncbi:MAG: beta-galactosidase [Kiritimatiellae bacterium]|nr:beta-galactosidase [Kiritimatiellia bacterium]